MIAIIVNNTVLGYANTAEISGTEIFTDGVTYGGFALGTALLEPGEPPADFAVGRYIWNGLAIVQSSAYTAQLLAEAISEIIASIDELSALKMSLYVTIVSLSLVTSFAPQWQGLINGAYLAAQANSGFTINWQGANGWKVLNASQVTTVFNAGVAYIQACFTRQQILETAVSALTNIAAVKIFDYTTGWPSPVLTIA